MPKIYGIIYRITNKINNKVYIGQTVYDFDKRYCNNLVRCTHNNHLKSSIIKYGIDNFKIDKEIDKAFSKEELNDKEIYWIKFYNCMKPNGYNLCEGGGNTKGYHHTEETKAKFRACKVGLNWGKDNPFYGKTHSDETKARFSKLRKGRKETEEWIRKKQEANFKKVINLDTLEVFISVKAAADKYKLKDTHISRVCKGKRNKTGGYRWMHYSEWLKINEAS